MNPTARAVRGLCLSLALSLAAAAGPAAAAAAETRGFTARDMAGLDRISDLQVSPDGRVALYDLRSTDWANNRASHALYRLELSSRGGAPQRLTISDQGANTARWSPDGRAIYFLSGRSGLQQLWRAAPDGSGAVQVTNLPLDVQAYRVSPDGRRLAVSLAVFPDCPTLACTVERQHQPKSAATGQIYDRLMVRHWDQWMDGTQNHLFVLELDPSGAAGGAAPRDVMGGLDTDVPGKPFGDEGDFVFAPDGRSLVISAKLKTGEAWSTNFDLYQLPLDGPSAPRNLTADNRGMDAGPVFSPDGASLAWRAMKRPGFESDRFAVMLMDLRSGATREVDAGWDRSPDQLKWSADGRTLYMLAEDVGQHPVFALDVASGKVRRLTGEGNVPEFAATPGGIVYLHDDFAHPDQVFAQGPRGAPVQLTHVDEERLAGVSMGSYEQFSFPGWNGETVHGYVVKPWNWQPGRKYPVAFLIHGGPQGSFGNLFHYRWNAQTYAGAGYAVVLIDFHGSTGYGQAFTDSISKHWGDRPLEDLQKGWAYALGRYPFLDGGRACALGGSYGGYMVNWIAGNWSAPWRCLVDHDGVFDNRMMGYATEELWFSEWENGGVPWSNPEGYERFNPVDHVADWSKPELVVQGGHDYRIPLEQGLGTFDALQRKGIPSRLLYFPDENHFVLKPANSVKWHQTVLDWLDRWTKP